MSTIENVWSYDEEISEMFSFLSLCMFFLCAFLHVSAKRPIKIIVDPYLPYS
jgi:hypothetical protein